MAEAQSDLPPYATRAFAIPRSNLVFDGSLTLESGDKVKFSAREGAMIMIEPTSSGWVGQIGLVLGLDRSAKDGSARRVCVSPSKIELDSAGGDLTTPQPQECGRYGEVIAVNVDGYDLQLSVTRDWLGSFQDAGVVTWLWEVLLRNPKALEGMYEKVYSQYGPRAQDCRLCYGALICSTDIVNCGDGSGGGGGQAY